MLVHHKVTPSISLLVPIKTQYNSTAMSCLRTQRNVPCPGFNLDRSNTLTNEAAPPVLKVKSLPPPPLPPVRYYCLPSKHVGFSVSSCLFSVLVKAFNNTRNNVIWCFDVCITIIIMRTGMPPFNNFHCR